MRPTVLSPLCALLLLLGGCADQPPARDPGQDRPAAPPAPAAAASVVWRWKAPAGAPDGRVGAKGDGWNTLIHLPAGTLRGGHEYLAELRYRVVVSPPYPGNPFFGCFHLFARSKTLGQERDVWQNWLGDPGASGTVRLPMVLAPADDWTFTVGCKGAGELIVEDLAIRDGTGFVFLPAVPGAAAGPAPAPVATGCPAVAIDPPANRDGPTLSVADFGMLPDGEAPAGPASAAANALGLQRALRACAARGAARLVIPAGTYRLAPKDPLQVQDLHDLVIDGQGALLVYGRLLRNTSAWNLHNCHRLAVRDLRIDWDWELNPIASLAEVRSVAADGRSCVLAFPDQDAATIDRLRGNEWTHLYPVDPRTLHGTGGGRLAVKVASREPAGPGALAVGLAAPLPLAAGQHYLVRHLYYEMGAFKINDSSHLRFERVTVWSMPGMGWVGRGDLHHLALVGCTIQRRPGTRRAFSTAADGFHILDSQGAILIEGCEITGTGDDCINIHDNCAQGVRKTGERTLVLVNNPRWRMKAAVGDRIELFRSDYAPTGWSGTAAAVAWQGNDAVIDFAEPLPAEVSPLSIVFNRRYGTCDVRIAGNRFDHGRVMISARRATIEGNDFDRPWGNAIQLATEIAGALWSEGSGNQDVVIRGNVIRGANPSQKFGGPAIHAVPVLPAGRIAHPLFRGILVEGNRFIDGHGPIIALGACADVVVRGNTIEADGPVPGANALAGCIKAECGSRLSLGGNTWKEGRGQARPGVLLDPATTSAVDAAGNRLAPR